MIKKNIRVYIASPYTLGDTGLNVNVHANAFQELLNHGFIPFAPLHYHLQHLIYPRPYMDWFNLGLQWLDVCDCILRLPGESVGATNEVDYATKRGIMVFYDIKELIKHYTTE